MRSATAPLPPEVRALTVLGTVPDGCRAMPVLDDRNAPHLRQGEVAVIDPTDCVLIHGELFAILYGSGPAIMQAIWRTRGDLSAWWALCLDRPKDWPEAQAWMAAGRALPMGDGPYRAGALEERTLGRVIGILQPATAEVHHG
jgi:hypothetical protein